MASPSFEDASIASFTALGTVLDQADAVVYVKDRLGRHRFVNRAFEELLDVPRGGAVGKTNDELYAPDVAASLTAHERRVLDSGGSDVREEEHVARGEKRVLLWRRFAMRAPDGAIAGLCGVAHDITAKHLAEARLREEQEITRRVVNGSRDGILAFDTECRYTVWNPAMERISGMPSSRVLGRCAFDVFPFLTAIGEDRYFHEALSGREAVSRDRPFTVTETGRAGLFEGRYSPLHDGEGRVAGGIAVIRDVTERRRIEDERLATARAEAARGEAEVAAQRFAFLADVSQTLASSLDYETTLAELARLALPELGDLCVVDVVEDGRVRRLAARHVRDDRAALMRELLERSPPAIGSRHPGMRVLQTERPELLSVVTPDALADYTNDDAHAAILRALGVRSCLAVPLVAHGVVFGAIGVAITESDRRYDAKDVAFAMDVARRAALAIDNARLYRAAQRDAEARRVSEERLRAVFDQSPLSSQIVARSGKLVRVNRAWEDLWGVTLEQIPEYNMLADPQLDAHGVTSGLRRAFAGEALELPTIAYDPNETIPDRTRNAEPVRVTRAFAYPIRDEKKEVAEVVLVQEDITARVRTVQRLRASEERLRLALQGARMSVWELDRKTNRVQCSENGVAFWGTEVGHLDDLLGVVHPDDRAAVERLLATTKESGAPSEAEHRWIGPDGVVRWLHSRGHVERGDDGRATRFLGVTIDVTDRHAAEEAMRLLADAGETLGASLDAHMTLQQLGRVVVPRLADWFAVDLVNDAGQLERLAVFHPDHERLALAAELSAKYPPRRGEDAVWRVIDRGEPLWVEELTDEQRAGRDARHGEMLRALQLRSLVCVPLVSHGTTIGAMTLVHAESNRRYARSDIALAEDLARRAATAIDNARMYQRLREEDRKKDEFLATLAHELRNPLAPLLTAAEVLRLSPSGDTIRRTRDVIERQVGHMARLVDDLLDVSRVTRGKVTLRMDRVDVASILATALEASRPSIDAAGLTLAVDVRDGLAVVGDFTRLAQVVSNLLDNAAKYTPGGGRIDLTAAQEEKRAVIRVRDTGVGIPRDRLAYVFEMFAQLHRDPARPVGGLGIGLTLVRRLIELHHGAVWAESDGPGEGSTFVVALPAADEAVA